jgi:hypothetical protein
MSEKAIFQRHSRLAHGVSPQLIEHVTAQVGGVNDERDVQSQA